MALRARLLLQRPNKDLAGLENAAYGRGDNEALRARRDIDRGHARLLLEMRGDVEQPRKRNEWVLRRPLEI